MTEFCQCPTPGYCWRHKMRKSLHLHHLCQTRADYRALWDWMADGSLPQDVVRKPYRKGPGDHLHAMLLKWFRVKPEPGCKCPERVRQMNAWGSAGCREHLDEIVEWLIEECIRRKIPVVIGTRTMIKRLVLLAIRKTEKEQ